MASSSTDTTLVVSLLDTRTVLLSLEAKSSLSKTNRRIIARMLVNPVEGCQRILQCQSVNTGKISTILSTKCDAETCAGLPGIYFAMSDVGAGTVAVRGPSGTCALVQAWKEFVRRKYPILEARDVESDGGPKQARFEKREGFDLLSVSLLDPALGQETQNHFCVWCSLNSQQAASASKQEADNPPSEEDDDEEGSSSSSSDDGTSSSQCEDDDEEEADSIRNHPLSPSPLQTTLCYVIHANGLDPQGSVAIIDCRDERDVRNLASNPHLSFGRCPQHSPRLIVHLGLPELVQSSPYQAWLTAVSASLPLTQHLYSSDDNKAHRFAVSLQWVDELSKIAPLFYAAPGASSVAAPLVSFQIQSNQQSFIQSLVVEPPADIVDDVNMMADQQPVSSPSHPPKTMKLDDDIGGSDPNEIDLEEADAKGEYPRLVFLGTGAAKPSTLRGLSCCQVWLDASNSILLDCGEDTLNQMSRYERANGLVAEACVNSVTMVWISHHHLDHHGGLAGVLARRQGSASLMTVFAPASVRQFISTAFAPSSINVFPCEEASRVMPRLVHGTARVDHCYDSHAIALNLVAAGKTLRLVYSGDTRPCGGRFRHFKHDNLVLIHEATFEDALIDEAQQKKHSTVGEALGVARELDAKLLVLTHFSQRYPKYVKHQDQIADVKRSYNNKHSSIIVVQAHDLMQVNLSLLAGTDRARLVQEIEKLEEHFRS